MSTEAVLVEDDDAQAEREDCWLSAMTKIHACVVGGALFDDGPSEAAIELALELSCQLAQAVEDVLQPALGSKGVK
jgi:hypothetical protein